MLSEPHWLILIFPLLCLVFWLKPNSKIILSIRVLLVLVLCFALASPVFKLQGREGMIVIVADRSSSMPQDTDKRIQETSDILSHDMPINSSLGLVSFTDKARIEFSPTKNAISAMQELTNRDFSNLSDGIELAVSMIPDGVSGRIIVLSDGLWNGNNPQNSVISAINRNIPIDYRYIGKTVLNDLAVTYLEVPKFLEPNEPFILRAGIDSPMEQNADIELFNGEKQLFKTEYHLKAGLNHLSFNLFAPSSSVAKYILKVFGTGKDSQKQNNVAKSVALVKGKKPALIVTNGVKSSIKNLLDKNNIESEEKNPRDISWNIDSLLGYSVVILENVPAETLGYNGMHSLAAWVKNMGGGLILTGGKNSYGNGGYFQSPLEDALPVSLEMRSEKRKMNIAIAVVLDRSGSMGMHVGGRTKMELADLGAAASLDLLGPKDEFVVFAVDTSPNLVVPLQSISSNKEEMRNKILSIQSTGGGIFVYEGIQAAYEALKQSNCNTRHIILFSDANDSEHPGEYWNLLSKAAIYNMTLSVIGLGKETDCDAEILKKIADEGKGRCFFTNEPEELPRLFTQDTFIAAKSTFIEEKVNIFSSGELNTIINGNSNFKSSIDAYNICYLKENATQLITAEDDDKSPILASWQYGLGKVACYTGVLSQEKGGEFLNSEYISKIFCGLHDWITFDDRSAIGDMTISQKIENGVWKVYLNLDPDRPREPFEDKPVIELLTYTSGGKPIHQKIKTNWETADQLSASYNIKGDEVISSVLRFNDNQKLVLAPVCQIYSPEYLPQGNRNGAKELKTLAKMTGGKELIDLNSVWSTMPLVYQNKDVSNYLFAFALFLFLLEIAERRLALVSIIMSAFKKDNIRIKKENIKPENKKDYVFEGKTVTNVASMNIPKEENKQSDYINVDEDDDVSDVYNALKKAKKKADRRTG